MIQDLLNTLYNKFNGVTFDSYLLENHEVTVEEFEEFVKFIPGEMLTKCRRPYVEKLYEEFRRAYGE